ncbi:TnsA endonuclease N-terminal domain-containing protein [Paenibacillus cremeus]|uniref:TnsA endonuclease N-terminal domain-containing protein n=1 Tax=Paenibacillus cremeus TaxID=2163881 RepID=A0A559K4H9_9BACL|nr:TnsA endonuclease N-terminal domain-containing protein [Paenibacillus cremeus]TVY07049.1 hypothetical protein FPZ49_26210 [Paenibacillus cremeus]
MQKPKIMPRAAKYGNNYWNSDGPKVGMREVTLYSDLEFDHWVSIETNPDVETYCEQYPEISFVQNDELHTSVFDMWLKLRDGTVICREVKYESELNPEDRCNVRTLRQIEAQQIYCKENGVLYEIITDKLLRKSHNELENRLKIISFVKNNPEPKEAPQIYKAVRRERVDLQTLSELLSIPYMLVHDACLWLFYQGLIHLNIDEIIICKRSEAWLRE